MNNDIQEILNNLSEALVILDDNFNIILWNSYMEYVSNTNQKNVLNQNIYKIMPELNKTCFKKSMNNIILNGYKMFFSSAMHKELIHGKRNFNLKISRFQINNKNYLLLEFIDVTNQFERIKQLKQYIKQLFLLNKTLKYKKNVIKNLAYYDRLTKVPNRTLFYKLAQKTLNYAKRNNKIVGLLFIDVDHFKSVNDNYGHAIGDAVLRDVALSLINNIREDDVVCRFGGDEFLVLLTNLKNPYDYDAIAKRLLDKKTQTLYYKNLIIHYSLSIGISFYPNDALNIDELITMADKAMYVAKKKGGNAFISTNDI